MKKYVIKINYNTGDSFHQESDVVKNLELEFYDIGVAEANVQRILEHYKFYASLNKRFSPYYYKDQKEKKEIEKEALTKDWAAKNKKGTKYEYDFCLTLYTDEGNPWRLSAFWCGYFESLNFVEIDESTFKPKIFRPLI